MTTADRLVQLIEDAEATARDAEVAARHHGEHADANVHARVAVILRDVASEARKLAALGGA